jgi:hypothetical protein
MDDPICILQVLSFIDDGQILAADFVAASRDGRFEAHIWNENEERRFVLGIFADVPSARNAIVHYRNQQQQHYERLGVPTPQ